MSDEAKPGRFKMMKVEYKCEGERRHAYFNPKEAVVVHEAWRYIGLDGTRYGDPPGAKTRISLRNGNDVFSDKEMNRIVAEIEAAANE